MKQTRFLKMHGLGNDFVIVFLNQELSITKNLVKKIADRKKGIGCDLVVFLNEEKETLSDLRVEFFNADGTSAELCGNALRCIGKYFFENSLKENIVVETKAGLIDIEKNKNKISVSMGIPKFKWQDIPLSHNVDTKDLGIKLEYLIGGFAVNVGNPHVVFFVDQFLKKKFVDESKKIQKESIFPQGININVVKVISKNKISIMTYERGVGLTDACGSGACASVVVSNNLNLCNNKIKLLH